jgi:chemotaxis protein methyltransferase CheR
MMGSVENENIEIELFIEAIRRKYGYDFNSYSKAFIKRRILRRVSLEGLKSVSAMQHKLLYDESLFDRLMLDLSINVTEMFRDPSFFKTIRDDIVPFLKELPHIKIWHAGCASGEEVYSMAILLREEGLYERAIVYATDFNEGVVRDAREGIYPNDLIKKYTANYHKAGGTGTFSDYYTADNKYAIISKSLKKNIVFAGHNLVIDGVFAEVDLVLCRNVLIYFNRNLQNRSIKLFLHSLRNGGFLCLGSKESVEFTKYADFFDYFLKNEKIYRKKRDIGPLKAIENGECSGDEMGEPAAYDGEVNVIGKTETAGGSKFEAVVIGVSAGGLRALGTILTSLPENFPLSVIIVQHQHETSDNYLIRSLNEQCRVNVIEALEKDRIVPGTIYVAPPKYHLMIERDRTFSLSTDEPVSYARPSIDVLFETAADVYRSKLIGIILTGANRDGSQGIRRIKERGGLAIVQEPASAEIETMPRAAIEATRVDHIVPLERIGTFLNEFLMGEKNVRT